MEGSFTNALRRPKVYEIGALPVTLSLTVLLLFPLVYKTPFNPPPPLFHQYGPRTPTGDRETYRLVVHVTGHET